MIFALERLRALRAVQDFDPTVINDPADLPMDWRIDWEERAAILEYDGGLNREEADRQALDEIVDRLRRMEGIS
ncbi:hypothetical protein [Anaerobaca lacustris]|uniref:Uncharacterized protein n=1 Tax=Anaerobaca lacustris TaxID=3044600 RepID=A0AAW6TXL3_9BACT|nr:hypothetical protein [Sedimentisphaerales bacterium M17dextr]